MALVATFIALLIFSYNPYNSPINMIPSEVTPQLQNAQTLDLVEPGIWHFPYLVALWVFQEVLWN